MEIKMQSPSPSESKTYCFPVSVTVGSFNICFRIVSVPECVCARVCGIRHKVCIYMQHFVCGR